VIRIETTARRTVLTGIGAVGIGVMTGCGSAGSGTGAAATTSDSATAAATPSAAPAPSDTGAASTTAAPADTATPPTSAAGTSTASTPAPPASGAGSPAAPTSAAAGTTAPAAKAAGFTVPTSKVPVGSGAYFADDAVVITQPTAGQFKAFSSVCTHQGCPVTVFSGAKMICPCHGSEYSIKDGSVLTGPAPTGLKPKTVTVQGSSVVVAKT